MSDLPTPYPSGAWDRSVYVREYEKLSEKLEDAQRDRDEWKAAAKGAENSAWNIWDERQRLRNAILDTLRAHPKMAEDGGPLAMIHEAARFGEPREPVKTVQVRSTSGRSGVRYVHDFKNGSAVRLPDGRRGKILALGVAGMPEVEFEDGHTELVPPGELDVLP